MAELHIMMNELPQNKHTNCHLILIHVQCKRRTDYYLKWCQVVYAYIIYDHLNQDKSFSSVVTKQTKSVNFAESGKCFKFQISLHKGDIFCVFHFAFLHTEGVYSLGSKILPFKWEAQTLLTKLSPLQVYSFLIKNNFLTITSKLPCLIAQSDGCPTSNQEV